ncbi:MAG TPA: SET domain-containing protein-lysine N-methyltransferase, partial [Flavobacterium sp.]|nr:SET domain-containing protein-lysine N-methyltransferase [Flavobacterium sp.]
KVAVKRSPTGLGLYAAEPIKKGQYVIEYVGPIINNKQVEEIGGRYLFEINSRKTIDGSSRKNVARYINHSCRPNCDIEIKKDHVYIVAKKSIEPGQELNYDYGKEYFNEWIKPFGCLCAHCVAKRKEERKQNKLKR